VKIKFKKNMIVGYVASNLCSLLKTISSLLETTNWYLKVFVFEASFDSLATETSLKREARRDANSI